MDQTIDKTSEKLRPWTLLSKETAFTTPWFTIEKQDLLTSNDTPATYYVHHGNHGVVCVCVTDDRQVMIERQYRPAVEKVAVDYPAGGIELDDKNPEEAMLRELQEETGYRPISFKKLAVVDSSPGFSSSRFHVFLAEGVIAAGDANPEPTESIVTEFVPARQILAMIDSGEMACASCVSATFYAFRELGWFKLDLSD